VDTPPESATTGDEKRLLGRLVTVGDTPLFLGIAIAPFVVSWIWVPIAKLTGFGSPVSGLPCPTRFFLGLPCPGCGLTRSLQSMAAGDFACAIEMHPLGPLLWGCCFAWGVTQVALPNRRHAWIRGTRLALGVALLAVYFWRLCFGQVP